MPKRRSTHPTEAELEILNVLWRCGPSTVRQAHDTLQADRKTGLTTTLKLLQVMTGKGLVIRDSSAYPDRFSPACSQKKAQAGLLKDLVRRAFDGSVGKMLIRAVEEGGLSKEELQEIRKLLNKPSKR
jgi:predicted transcriptional regulator